MFSGQKVKLKYAQIQFRFNVSFSNASLNMHH